MLIGAIAAQGAEVDTVLPYVYDAQAADANIVTAIDEMAQGRIDAIALTNLGTGPPPDRSGAGARMGSAIARGAGTHADRLGRAGGLGRTQSHGLRTDIYPANDAFFMRPLISAMAAALGKSAAGAPRHRERSEAIQP